MDQAPIVVIGGGLAAGTAVTELRERGYAGPVVVLTDEPHLPYERPPLSKAYLMGEEPAEKALVQDKGWYAERDVDVRTDTAVTAIDTDAQTVTVGDETIPYAQLLIATGARSRHLAMADDSGAPVAYLRTLGDSTSLRAELTPGRRIAILGGGWIGLEVAAAARAAGADVVLLEAQSQPLLGVLGEEVAASFAALHREQGVDLRTDVEVTAITALTASTEGTNRENPAAGGGVRLEVAGDDPVDADLLVVGIGAEPVTDLAEAAGLEVDDGIRVDSHLRTSDPLVLAAGDVANADHPVLGRPLRVEHWDTARQHGKVAAATMLGEDLEADALPYFFTDQYDFGMEYVGNPGPDGFDQVVVRGSLDGDRVYTAWWLRGDLVVAGMQANDWDAIDDVRRIVGQRVDPHRLADRSVPLSDLPG